MKERELADMMMSPPSFLGAWVDYANYTFSEE